MFSSFFRFIVSYAILVAIWFRDNFREVYPQRGWVAILFAYCRNGERKPYPDPSRANVHPKKKSPALGGAEERVMHYEERLL